MPRYFRDGELVIKLDGDVISVLEEIGGGDSEEYEDEPEVAVRRGRPKAEKVEKKVRNCKKCSKPGHRSDNCTNDLSDLKEEKEDTTSRLEEDLVVEIRNRWVVDGESAIAVASSLGITLGKFNALVQKHGLHR